MQTNSRSKLQVYLLIGIILIAAVSTITVAVLRPNLINFGSITNSTQDEQADEQGQDENQDPSSPETTPVPEEEVVDDTVTSSVLRVIEVRYFALPKSQAPYQPDQLSIELSALISRASKELVSVEIVDQIDHLTARSQGTNWFDVYTRMLRQNNLCSRIKNENIDQIWLWVDPRPNSDPGPGMEYVISSSLFEKDAQYATTAPIPFCDNDTHFVIMGFDYTRQADMALHSFGHYMEGLLGNIQSVDLFWYAFSGINSAGYPLNSRCGNVHFPPNGTTDYDYTNQTFVSNSYLDWNPQLSGEVTTYNCNAWNCNHSDFLVWWMNKMPGIEDNLTYEDKLLPPWWDFVVNLDAKILKYSNNPKYYMNRDFIQNNNQTSSCSCSGADQNNNPITVNRCNQSVIGADWQCYTCRPDGWKVISPVMCE